MAWHDTSEGPASRRYSLDSGSDGSYSVSIDGGPGQPLPAGGWADVGVHDSDGHRTYMWAAVPLVDLTLAESEVAGRVSPLAGVNLSLERSGTTVAHASVQADTVGAFAASLGAASAGRITAGDRLMLESEGDPPASIDVPELTIALDRVVQVVRGRAPAGSAVSVRLVVAGHPTVELRAVADATGAWSIAADRLPDGVTIDDVLDAEASVRVGNGHRVAARPESGRRTPTAAPEPSPTTTPTPVVGPSPTIATPSATAGASPTTTNEAGARAYLPSALRSPAVGGAGRGRPGP